MSLRMVLLEACMCGSQGRVWLCRDVLKDVHEHDEPKQPQVERR